MEIYINDPLSFSQCCFLAEQNYDGNRKLFAVLLALQEWLEGSEQPFVVWTDNKNLFYLLSDKKLNSC